MKSDGSTAGAVPFAPGQPIPSATARWVGCDRTQTYLVEALIGTEPVSGPVRDQAADEIRRLARLVAELGPLAAAHAELVEALEKIANHWACDYDHKHANTEAYRGSYGIGIVDGHRAAAAIARAALSKTGG